MYPKSTLRKLSQRIQGEEQIIGYKIQIKNKSYRTFLCKYFIIKAKHNVGDCPLAQSIVVGLLRSLLTICNSQMHKKFNASPSKGMGADSYREWQISYQFVAQSGNLGKDYREYLSNKSQNLLKNYIQYNESAI